MDRRSAQLWLAAAIVALAGGFLPAGAAAAAGDGLKAGNLKLHPSITLSGSFDQNVFRENPGEIGRGSGVASAPIVAAEPSLAIDTVDTSGFAFSLNSSVEWEQYLSSRRYLRRQSGLNANADVGLTLNKQGAISLELRDNFRYTNEPPPERSPVAYNRLINKAGARVGIHPGDDILEFGLGYQFGLYRYLDEPIDSLAKNQHKFDLDFTWRFLPKTSLVVNGSARIINYILPERRVRGSSVTLPNNNSTPIRVVGGLSGLLSRRISVRVLGGYSTALYENGPTFAGPLAQADMTYKYGDDDKLSLGYKFGFKDSSISNYYTFHRGSLAWQQGLANGRWKLNAAVHYTRRDYSRVPNVRVLPQAPYDNFIEGDAGVTFNAYKWWNVGLNYGYSQNITNTRVPVSGAAPDQLAAFSRHVVSLNTTFRY